MKNLSSHIEDCWGLEEMTSILKWAGMAMVEAREVIEQSGKPSVFPPVDQPDHCPDPDPDTWQIIF